MRRPLSAILITFLLLGVPAYPWWESGHRTIARIAAAHLTPAARARIARILNVSDTPDAVADALAAASTWADETKAQTKTRAWHFIDLTLQDHKSDIPKRCENDDCAPARIRFFAARLAKGEMDQRWSELDSLRYLVHFVGDIHQPLHAISDADLGGNCETVDPPVSNAKNLHALWDGGILSQMNPGARELAAELDETEIAKMSNWHRDRLAHGDPDDWTWESHLLAERVIYARLHIPTEPSVSPTNCSEAPAEITNLKLQIDSLYINDMKPIIRLQLVKAGLRLAKLLNQNL